MSLRSVVALARFELSRSLRDPVLVVAVIIFTMLLAVGAWLYWRSLPPRPSGSRLFGEAYFAALIVAWHTGIARDRATHFDRYLGANFVTAASMYFGKVVAAIAWLVLFTCVSFILALLAAAGSLSYAGHYSTLFLLHALFFLPGMVLIELAVSTRNPLPLVCIALFAFVTVYGRLADVQALLRLLVLDGSLDPWRLGARTLIALFLTCACYPLFRLRLGATHLAHRVAPP